MTETNHSMHAVFPLNDNRSGSTVTMEEDYSNIAHACGLKTISHAPYWQVGKIESIQGWIIFLTSVERSIPYVLGKTLPFLASEAIPFRMIMNRPLAASLLQGGLGHAQVGKVICIYPPLSRCSRLAATLVEITAGSKGPAIPSAFSLGNAVYVRYGSYETMYELKEDGSRHPLLYDSDHRQYIDANDIPFKLPAKMTWPFSDIKAYKLPRKKRWINRRYLPVTLLKADPKGNVWKAIDFRRVLKPNWCLIKQGKRDMLSDQYGRDMQDRIFWQLNVAKALGHVVHIPRVLDQFKDEEDGYLVTEYIEGLSVKEKIDRLFAGRHPGDLSIQIRREACDLFIAAIGLLKSIHAYQYVHRDFTPTNLLLDKKGQLYLIDLELAYSMEHEQPSPPFKLGTRGFMSPAQLENAQPTFQEDIYAVGAFMIFIFTGLEPLAFGPDANTALAQNLSYYIADPILVDLIMDCLHADPVERPNLQTIESTIKHHRIASADPFTRQEVTPGPDNAVIRQMIQYAIDSYGVSPMLNPDGRWFSNPISADDQSYGSSFSFSGYAGFREGRSGVLYLLYQLKTAGFVIDACEGAINKACDDLFHFYINDLPNFPAGLFGGGAGVAIGLQSVTLHIDPERKAQFSRAIESCLRLQTASLNLANGVAGQLLAAVYVYTAGHEPVYLEMVQCHIEFLLDRQQKNSSWAFPSVSPGIPDDATEIGFAYGTAGLLFALLSAYTLCQDERLAASIHRGMDYLNSRRGSANINFPPAGVAKGDLGLALVHLRAYEVFNGFEYRRIARQLLLDLPPNPVSPDLTWTTGLSGLGEIYLEAFRLLNEPVWRERAAQIAASIQHMGIMHPSGSLYWAMNNCTIPTADLMTGNGAVLHFLLRYLDPHRSCWYKPIKNL